MSRIRSSDTSLELKVRKYLYKSGLRYRIHYKIKGKPDIVFLSKKIAIFLNGCFWHMHGCQLSTMPKSNQIFWIKKLERNKERDLINANLLKSEGWKIYIVWECDLLKDPEGILKNLVNHIKGVI